MNRQLFALFLLAALAVAPSCFGQAAPATRTARDYKVVHVFVALCDNKNQGIVKVPAELGNGQSPATNLYWGALYGADTFFRRSADWTALKVEGELPKHVLARSAFKAKGASKVIVFIEAYDGAFMKDALTDFLSSAAGLLRDRRVTIADGDKKIELQAWGFSDLVCFVGHNGLMDVKLDATPESTRAADKPKQAVVLACFSRSYFTEPLKKADCSLLIASTHLMSPEAYTLDAIVRSWAAGETSAATREKAAAAYAKYQKCPLEAARRLLVTAEAH